MEHISSIRTSDIRMHPAGGEQTPTLSDAYCISPGNLHLPGNTGIMPVIAITAAKTSIISSSRCNVQYAVAPLAPAARKSYCDRTQMRIQYSLKRALLKGEVVNTPESKMREVIRRAIVMGLCVSVISAAFSAPAMSAETAPVAATATASGNADSNTPVRRPPMEMIRLISFRLRDGRMASGRVVSDDRAQVTVSEPAGGVFVATSYSRLDMEPRSISYQTVSEYQYWMNMAQYFESRTWDFRDDADEFAQALRCYQTAHKVAVSSMGEGGPVARDVELRISKLLDSRKRWIEDAKPRAEMAELELKSTLGERLDEISNAVNSLRVEVERVSRLQAGQETNLASFKRDIDAKLSTMADDIRRNYEYARDSYYRPGTIITPVVPAPK